MSEIEEHIPGAGNDPASPPAMPVLPDGIGLTYDEIATLLARKGQALPPDDPVMMLIPICNALLTHQQKLMEHHRAAFDKIMAERTGRFVGSIGKVSEELGTTFSSSVVQSLQQAFAAHTRAMLDHGRRMTWITLIAGGIAVFSAGSLIGFAFALLKISSGN